MKNNLNISKLILPVLVVFAVVFVIVGLNWLNAKPEVITAKATLTQAQTGLWKELQPVMKDLPNVFTTGSLLAVAIFGSLAGFIFIATGSMSVLLRNVDHVLSHGLTYERTENGQTTRVKLFQDNPVPHKLPRGGGGRERVNVEPPMMLDQGRKGGGDRPNYRDDLRHKDKSDRRAPGRAGHQQGEPFQPPIPFPVSGEVSAPSMRDDPLNPLF